jgi:integrase/recombinase XerD
MTALRQRMIEDMQLRNLGSETQRAYVFYIKGLAQFYQTSPDQLSLEDIREYQLYLINERRLSPESVNQFVSAAKFFYTVTLETPWPETALPRCRVPHQPSS